MKRYLCYIDGKSVKPASGAWFETINPYTREPWALIPRSDELDVNSAIEAANRAYNHVSWRSLSASKRGALLRAIGDTFSNKIVKRSGNHRHLHPEFVGRTGRR